MRTVRVPRHQLSRALYANPVCVLTAHWGDKEPEFEVRDTGSGRGPEFVLPPDGVGRDASSSESSSESGSAAADAAGSGKDDGAPVEGEGGVSARGRGRGRGGLPRLPPSMMVITWVTAVNNTGMFVCSMNRNRYSAAVVRATRRFVLSVPTADATLDPDTDGAEPTLSGIGGRSGFSNRGTRAVDLMPKAQRLGVALCAPGFQPLRLGERVAGDNDDLATAYLEEDEEEGKGSSSAAAAAAAAAGGGDESEGCRGAATLPEWEHSAAYERDHALVDACAHMTCTILSESVLPDGQHWLFTCQIDECIVEADYWKLGKILAAAPDDAPTLAFAGGGIFAHTVVKYKK